MGSKWSIQYLDALSIAIVVCILDLFLYSYFLQANIGDANTLIFADVIIVFLAAVIGRRFAKDSGLPVWRRSHYSKNVYISVLIGICIISLNTYILCSYNTDEISWLKFASAYQPLFLAIRAAITEEVVFRLLIFSFIIKLANKISKSNNVCFILGALISAAIFAMLHNGSFISFIFGIGLCYIYMNTGLIPAMIVHFLADAFPFLWIYIK